MDEFDQGARMTEIADRHARELFNILMDRKPVSIEFIEELMRCAIEEYAGEGRQEAINPPNFPDHLEYL